MPKMPKLPVDAMVADLDGREEKLVRAAFRGATDTLRATKPFRTIDYGADDALFKACANYVWRMLCFDYAGFHPHNCMPVTADWDIGAYYYRHPDYADRSKRRDAERSVRDALDALVKRVESVLPIMAQKGVMQWGRALGMI